MDWITDNNPKEYDFLKSLLNDPEFSCGGSAESFKLAEDLPKTAFAHPSEMEYPMDDAHNTYHSMVYLEAYRNNLEPELATYIGDKLTKAAEYFGITKHMEQITEKSAVLEKSASVEEVEQYALEFEEGGTKFALYPINDAHDVIDSASLLANDQHKMGIDWAYDAAHAIMKAAEVYGVDPMDIPDAVLRLGIDRELNSDSADSALNQRLNFLDEQARINEKTADEETKEIYKDTFEAAKAASNNAERRELLVMISDLDYACKMSYDHVVDPFTGFYTSIETAELEKMAASYVFIGDANIPVDAFLSITTEQLWDNFSKEVATTIDSVKSAVEDSYKNQDVVGIAKASKTLSELGSGDKADLLTLIVDVAIAA